MTVDDAVTGDPFGQERTSAVDVPVCQASNIVDQLSILSAEAQAVDLDQALLPEIMEGRRSRDGRDLVTSRRVPMKRRNR